MNESTHEVAVLGLGGMGSAAFAELARRGVDVVGVDRWQPPHDQGSSHGQSRIFRIAYFEHPDYVPLARRSGALWREIDARHRERVFIETGGAWMGDPESEIISGSLKAAEEHGLEHEILDPDEVRRRWPAFRPSDGSSCFYEKDTGLVCPENAITVMLREAVEAGGVLRCGERVTDLDCSEKSVMIRTSKGTIKARKVILSAGAWTSGLIDCGDITLQPTRQLLGWTTPRDPEPLREGRMPIWAFTDDDEMFQYGFPICDGLPGPRGPKFARHHDGTPTSPDAVDRVISPRDEEELIAGLESRIPAAAGPLKEAQVCLYTLSPDRHFLIDHHQDHSNVVLACGFSGHGFKFCPVLGEGLADLVLDGDSALPLGFLSRERFG